jgi:hypothetical protein
MINSPTPKALSIWASATSAAVTENTPISAGVKRRLTIVTVAMLKTKVAPDRVNVSESALRILGDFID